MTYITNKDPFLEISMGNVPGKKTVNKFGINTNVASDTEEDIWSGGGDYPYPTSAVITTMSQTSDQVAMRGAEIEWEGLDENWNEVSVLANLDASDTTTPVTLSTPLIRVFRGDVNANVVADSSIRLHDVTETTDYAVIEEGFNQTTMALYTVPAGKTAYLTRYYCTSVESTGKQPKSTRFALYTADRLKNYEFQLKHVVAIPEKGSQVVNNFSPPAGGNSASERTDIKITARPIDQAADVAAGFDLILIDN